MTSGDENERVRTDIQLVVGAVVVFFAIGALVLVVPLAPAPPFAQVGNGSTEAHGKDSAVELQFRPRVSGAYEVVFLARSDGPDGSWRFDLRDAERVLVADGPFSFSSVGRFSPVSLPGAPGAESAAFDLVAGKTYFLRLHDFSPGSSVDAVEVASLGRPSDRLRLEAEDGQRSGGAIVGEEANASAGGWV